MDEYERHTNMEFDKQRLNFLEHHTDFDWLIMETSNDRDYWIQVSCRKARCRQQMIDNLIKTKQPNETNQNIEVKETLLT